MSYKVSVSLSESTRIAVSSTSKSSTVLAIAFKQSPLENKSAVRVNISLGFKVALALHSNGCEI